MEMPGWLDLLGGLIEHSRGFWRKVGDLETDQHQDALAAIAIDRPVYIAGIARSGSTILLEMLSRHPDVATHQYRDFPLVLAPVHWNRVFGRRQAAHTEAVERAHQDRIKVTPSSPEAMEEVLWMAFFPHLHDPARSQVLDATTSAPAFEEFYRAHIKKLLMIRDGRRYLAKANYDVTRLAYLHKLFPDARFIVPVREPLWHVASLVKQHRLFVAAETADPRIRRHMRRAGHFEFGLDRRAINANDDEEAARVEALWSAGRDAEGYARLWARTYGFVLDQLALEPTLAHAVRFVRYEDFCGRPANELEAIAAHVGLDFTPSAIVDMAAQISSPDYYSPGFDDDERALITEITRATAARLGYGG
jgi:hypothetical protein